MKTTPGRAEEKQSTDDARQGVAGSGRAPAPHRPAPAWRRALAAVAEFFAFCRRNPLWTVAMAVFIAAWTMELHVVQGYTLVFPNEVGARFAMWAPKIRLVLDLLFIAALTIALRRRLLIVAVIASFFIYLGLITYYSYFLKPLSLLTLMSSWREGLAVGGFALDMYPKVPALLLLAALAVKLTALVSSRKASLPRPSAWVVGTTLFALYATVLFATTYLDPLNAIMTTRGVGRLGHIRGYLGPWVAEWYYLRDNRLLERALEVRKISYNRITPLEADIPIRRRIVIVQAESLDTNVLNETVNGALVTPFLHSLRQSAMYYRVRSVHNYASADADFAVLNGVRGSTHDITYRILGYPYENTTPQLLASCGFETYAFHGNSGEFYNRRAAYEKMGFAGLRFREELEGRYGLRAQRWGIQDADVLRTSAQELRVASPPTCHFVITLTTHTPYTLLPSSELEVFPQPASTAEHYLNNMRYLDNCLRDYVTSLGNEVTVMIYADHPTELFPGFRCDRQLEPYREYIPCLIYDPQIELSKLQATRDDPRSTDGTWNLVDVANYLRGQIKRVYGQPGRPTEGAAPTAERPAARQEVAN